MIKEHYRFTEFPPDSAERVEALLEKMTLDEKIGQMNQAGPGWQRDLEADIRAGCVGTLLSFHDVAQINHLQRIAVEETRLGIPLILGNDVIHGYRTMFPIPLAESCTWDTDLLERAAHVAADEAAACGTDWIFAPMVDVARDPRWGRVAEGAGEDPFLGAELARARVRGFQARGLAGGKKIVACPKHYAAYGLAEAGRDYNTVDISERTLRDVYLPPFKATFDEGAGTVMSSFNETAGVPSAANAFLLKTVLRDEWDWPGICLSDYDAVQELIFHGMAADLKEAACKSALAGQDIDMMSYAFVDHLADLVREGAVPETVIDEAVRRVLRIKFALGIFEQPYTDAALETQVVLKKEHRALALEVAQKSIVLLKNEGQTLPLSSATKKIALIGPLADADGDMLGCWHCVGRAEDVETVLDGVRAVLAERSANVDLVYAPGCDIVGDAHGDFGAAVTAAQLADVAVLVLGESAQMSGEAKSRAFLNLPGQQQALLEAVVATGTPVVVVLATGRPLVLPWLAEHVAAIVQAWHGGTHAGRAVADVLFGNVNPSGKLTLSFPRAMGQIPVYYAHKNTGRPAASLGIKQFESSFKSDYIDERNAPLYGFGYGLSYTTFAYTDLDVKTSEIAPDGTLVVSATITNAGNRAGDEIVQLYIRDRVGQVTRPVKELKGFQKITLEPGQSQPVTFEIPVPRLGFHGLDMTYIVEPGDFNVWIGPNAAEGLKGTFRVVA